MLLFEEIRDDQGSAWIGWIEPRVLYTRFEHVLTAALAERVAERFTALMQNAVVVHYFNDTSNVESYELAALTRLFDAMVSIRSQFARIVVLPWSGTLGQKAADFASAFHCFEYAASRHAFEKALASAAPSWRPTQTPAFASENRVKAPRVAREMAGPPPATKPSRGSTYTYIFDLTLFEEGQFTATRQLHLSSRPQQTWVCVARDDEHALSLARQAALVEWAQPTTRRPEDFTVRFLAPFGAKL